MKDPIACRFSNHAHVSSLRLQGTEHIALQTGGDADALCQKELHWIHTRQSLQPLP